MDEKKEVQSQSTLPVEPTTQIQPPPIESGSKKKLVFGLLGVLLLLGIGAGVYYFINKQPTTDNSQLTTISPTVQPTIDPTAEWKTFSAPEFYTIKYPNEWYQYGAVDLPKDGSFTEYFATKPDSDNGWYDLDPDDYSISLHASPISATTYESGKTYLTMFPSGQQKVGTKMIDSKEAVELVGLPNVGGVQGIEVERSSVPGFDGGSFYIREAIFQKGAYIYLFRFFANDRQIYLSKKDTYDQILSTFKFTDSDQTVDTSDWKTFSNSQYNYSFKYPANWIPVEFDESDSAIPPGRLEIGSISPTNNRSNRNEGYDVLFSMIVYDKSKVTTDQIISKIGSQFADRKEKRESVLLNGKPATKVIISTNSNIDWMYLGHFIEDNNIIYDFGNGAVAEFNDTYNQIVRTVTIK